MKGAIRDHVMVIYASESASPRRATASIKTDLSLPSLICAVMPKTEGSVWSFNLRSYNAHDFSDPESDDALPDNLCSDGSTLVDYPLSEDNDTAVFKPNPWSIAKINAASRSAPKYALRL